MNGIELDLGSVVAGLHSVPIETLVRIYAMLMDIEVRVAADIELNVGRAGQNNLQALRNLSRITDARRHVATHIRAIHRMQQWHPDVYGVVAGEV